MKLIGMFEAKTHLSEICEQVAATREPVTVTKRGRPIVRIDPVDARPMTIQERREAYMAQHARDEADDSIDFAPPERSSDLSAFAVED